MPFIYMDLMKQAIPDNYICEDENVDPEIQFAVFGTYDWLHCDVKDGFPSRISELKEAHEDRHNVCWNYERQPVFLYFREKDRDKVSRICDNTDQELMSYPLVMTLLQVEKKRLFQCEVGLDSFLDAFQKKALEALERSQICAEDVHICICWNLNGSDVLILSRTKQLSNVSKIIGVLQKEGIDLCDEAEGGQVHVPVFSFSSHCAFSCGKRQDGAGDDLLSENFVDESAVTTWIDNDPELKLLSFVETSFNYDGIISAKEDHYVLFGERDYRIKVQSGQVADAIIDRLNPQSKDQKSKYRYRSSYLVLGTSSDHTPDPEAAADLEPEDSCNLAEENTDKEMFDDMYELFVPLKGSLEKVQAIVEKRQDVFGNKKDDSQVPTSQQIDHCIHSLMGLLKYAMRLQATINQYDLFLYISKLYGGLYVAVKKYEERIIKMDEEPDTEGNVSDYMRKFVWDLIMQIMSFVSELQHLFSVLALSPHNYMETYSSSMRSLNAASKLWAAYNGLIEETARLFQTKIGDRDQVCTVMLSPYRERKSQNTQYLAAFAEENTLVLIQMNFALMFKPEQAVYMIVHECGHHFSDHCRTERFEYMTKAFFSYILEAVYRPLQVAPLHLLVSVEDKAENQEEIRKKLSKYVELSKKEVKDAEDYRKLLSIHVLNDTGGTGLDGLYAKWSEELRAFYKYIFETGTSSLFETFEKSYNGNNKSGWKHDNYFGDELEDAYSNIRRNNPAIYDVILKDIANQLSLVNAMYVNQLFENRKEDGIIYDLNQMARLSAFWTDKRAAVWNKKQMSEEVKKAIDVAPKHTIELFREIFADIFAVLVLDMGLEEYKSIILSFSDMYSPILENPLTIRRIYAVFATVFGEREGLREWIQSEECRYAEDVRQKALLILSELELTITRDYITQYGDACVKCVRDRIAEIQKTEEGTASLNRIRSLYRQDGSFIDSLWCFWKGKKEASI